MKPAVMSDAKLDAAWCAIDGKLRGFVTAAEFGPFMKLGGACIAVYTYVHVHVHMMCAYVHMHLHMHMHMHMHMAAT